MAPERDRSATVISQEGSRLQVEHAGQRLSVPMRGFPEGFTLRAGSRVILYDEPSGPVARPLVRAIRSTVRPEEVQRREGLQAAGSRLEMQPGTIVEERAPAAQPASDEYELWVVERAGDEIADQVIAARRRR